METHGVKHHYHLHHHHHQTTQPASHHSNHSSLSNSQPFSFGSNPSPGQSQSSSSKLNFETSAAFPLLLSSIESGRVNFVNPKPVAFARPKCSSTFSCNQNGNVNQSQAPSDLSQHSSNTLTHSSQVGAGKHRHESLQQSNGGVKATPKQKSAATPNLIASSGRQQAFGHSTNGHAQGRSQASHLTGEGAASATLPHGGGLSFKKNPHARETPLNNNGTCNRSRTSPNKENKTTALPATTAAPTDTTTTGASNGAPVTATANRRPSIRSPTRTSGSNAAKSAPGSGNVPPFSNSYNHQRATSAVERITNGNVDGSHGIVPNHRPPTTALAPSQTCPSKPRPLKEFKFFKERAKDKLNKYQGANTGNDIANGAKTGSKAISKFSLSSNSTKGKSSGAVKRISTKSSPKTAKANGLLGKSKSNTNYCESAIGDKVSSHPPPAAKLYLPDTAVTAIWKDSPVGEPAVKANTSATTATDDGEQIQIVTQVVYYREAIVDGFTFQAFDDIESLEFSLQDAVSQNLPVLNYSTTTLPSPSTDIAPQQPTPVSQPATTLTAPSSSQLSSQPPATTAPSKRRIIFRLRSPSPSSPSSSFSSDDDSDVSDDSTVKYRLSSRPSGVRSLPSSRRPANKSAAKSKESKSKKPTASKSAKKAMTKDSKSKKSKEEVENESSDDSDEEDVDDEEEKEDDDEEEEAVSGKASRKSKVSAVKCTHKHPRSQSACNRCLLARKKTDEKKEQTSRLGKNKKGKAALASSAKAKCKNSAPTKGGGAPSKGKRKQQQQAHKKAPPPTSDDDDSSDGEHSDDDDDDDLSDSSHSSDNDESDATQEETDSDQSEEECEGTKRTIADLIKCSNRREAVRKAAERAALASVNARAKANKATPAPTNEAASTSTASLGPPATSDAIDVDLLRKIFKLKKLPNKNKSSGAIVTTSKRKHHSGKKRSQSDDSSNDDNELSESGEDETQSNASPRRCRTGKKASNGKVSGKRTKLAAAVVDDSCDEDEESDLGEKEEANLKKGKALKRNICGNGAKKQTKKKSLSSKQTKGVKSKTKKQIDSDDESNEDEEDHDDNMSDGEEVADQNLTDDAVVDEEEEETHESDNERRPKATKGNSKGKEKKGKASGKAPARTGKGTKPNASKPKASKGTKKNEKVASKKNVKDQSDDDTEESEHEDGNAEKKDVEVPPAHWTKASDNVKSKCDKSKAKTVTEAANTRSATECPVKDVYTFELSPAEVPTATTTRLVLSSSHESRSRQESHLRVSESSDPSTGQTDGLPSVSLSTGVSVNTNSPVPIKSSFSPQIVADGPVHKEGPAFEPLPPDAFSSYEPPFGPNASLSSLSQLSQSIGGGAGHGGGPILLNHQAPTNKCPLNIKEEPKEESPTSIRLAHPKVAVHETPPPVVVEHLSASQHFGPSVNSKNAHSRRMWSNASTGSLISSSSSSSSSPVHLAFGQCPPAPPTPATPASLANFFTPSNSLPVLTSSFYPPNSQDLIRRDLDSRLLASANDRNLLPSPLGIPPPGASLSGNPPHVQSSFNHAPTSPMVPASRSTLLNSSSPLVSSNSSPFNQIARNSNCIESPASRSQSPKGKALSAKVEKGTWSSMHVKIAKDIFQRQKEQLNGHSRNSTSSLAVNPPKSSTSSHQSHKSSKSSSSAARGNEPPAAAPVNYQQQHHHHHAPVSASPKSATSTKTHAETVNASSANSSRPASATTFNSNYPPRYGTPFGAASISAPPMMPGLFPPSPMNLAGFLPSDSWARPPFPGTMTAPNSVASRTPAPFMFPDYYANVNSASSALSAWAAGIRPPGESFTPPSRQAAESLKPSAPSSNSSQKRKHDDLEAANKERVHSLKHHHSASQHSSGTAYQNGDIRGEQLNKRSHSSSSSSSSRHHKSESAVGGRASLENGERTRAEFQQASEFSSSSKSSKSSHEGKPTAASSSRHPGYNASSNVMPPVPSPSPFAGASLFPTAHSPFPPPNDHQRYMEMLAMGSSLTPPTSMASFMASARNNADLASRPLWPFGFPPPTSSASVSSAAMNSAMNSAINSAMMADPFKSLTDISLRPGLVTPDRENLFSRFSLLSSGGGGASIFDKLSKEQLEKYDMLQGGQQGKQTSTANATVTSGNCRAGGHPPPMEASSSSSSRPTLTQRVSLPPPPLPVTSLASSMPQASTNPFSYPSSYLNPLHHLSAPGSYLSQASQLGGHPSFVTSNPMLSGVDLAKMALGHPGAMSHLPPGFPSDTSQYMLPPHFPGAGPMMNFLKGHPPSSTNFNSTR